MLKYFILILLISCNVLLRENNFPLIPQTIDIEYCSDRNKIGLVSNYIKQEIGKNSWEDVQSKLVSSEKSDEINKSLNLQKARNTIASCVVVLFEAIPTGSARNLNDISITNALKDIDMSVSYEKLENANNYIKSFIPMPEKTISLSILMNPIDILPCKRFKSIELKECDFYTSLETTQVLLLREYKELGKTDDEVIISASDWKKFCSGEITLPDKSSKQYRINLIESKEALIDLIELMPQTMNSSNNYTSALRYNFFFIALNNPAYYLQAGSIRKWVIDREEIFSRDLKQKFPEYAKVSLENEIESAVIEQWIHGYKNNNNIYYKYKYLFRALDHINYDYKSKLKDIFNIHSVIKKNRPDTIKNAFESYSNEIKKNELNQNNLKKYSINEFTNLFISSEEIITNEINLYFDKRKKEGNSIYEKVCRK